MSEMDKVRDLIDSPIENKAESKKEARSLLKKFFKSRLEDKYALFTPTYKSKVSKKDWMKEASAYEKTSHPRYRVKKITLRGGCLIFAQVVLQHTSLGHTTTQDIVFGLIRESAPYKPDTKSPYRINGATAPPWVSR